MKKIGLLTSGGDSSGMNAAIRSVVRKAEDMGIKVLGFIQGYQGLIENNFKEMGPDSVEGIVQRGGTILRSARCLEFKSDWGQKTAMENIAKNEIDGMIIIGGDGSLRGAQILHDLGIPCIGLPASIDNDIYGTDMAIGVDTALNNIVHAVDSLRDTASSHDRAFILEVMGRSSGYLALTSAIACAAEAVLIPEVPYNLDAIGSRLLEAKKRGKTNSIVIVAEGAASAYAIEMKLKSVAGFETRITVLGHLQRGGDPTVFDRLLSTRLGASAVRRLAEGERGTMVGLIKNEIVSTPFKDVFGNRKVLDEKSLAVARSLSGVA
ncbi:MAG: 6-phosphofructokinase [Nitrospirae bacterium]|nr:6-phosphofructokinase [Nitrospirota bacterium]